MQHAVSAPSYAVNFCTALLQCVQVDETEAAAVAAEASVEAAKSLLHVGGTIAVSARRSGEEEVTAWGRNTRTAKHCALGVDSQK